jgi:phosphatidylglycerol:prolipoprotein diacylglycerol transferase
MIIVAIAALIGGRAYHVIDQWQLYKDDLTRIVLPPYAGLGVYGGIFGGLIAVIVYVRLKRQSFWAWADVIVPGLFAMEFVARWGNFFNQELYGPPTTAPWGIAIDCAHRVAGYLCPPDGTTPIDAHFQPLFLYESISGLVGMLTLLWLSRRFAARLRTGEIALTFFVWYAAVRFMLEFLRVDNWTFFGIPMAQLISAIVIVLALALLVVRRGRIPPGLSEPAEPEPDDDEDDERDEDDDPEDEPPEAGEPHDHPDEARAPEAGAAGT